MEELRVDEDIDNTVIKEYEINPLLLPSEDYEMLLNGISAQSIENADMLAEDFDG